MLSLFSTTNSSASVDTDVFQKLKEDIQELQKQKYERS